MWDFTSPRKVIFGEDALEEYFAGQTFSRAFVVTDPTMKELHFPKLEKVLKEIGTEIVIFDEIQGEPSLQDTRNGAKLLAEAKPDVIIALGGGSVMDVAKGMWPMWAYPDVDVESLDPVEKLDLRDKTKAILVNIPTTSGTGSDATWSVVLTDKDENRKLSLGNRELVADVTVLDTVFTKTLPSHLVAGTGIDALCHAIDGYLSTWRNDFSDALVRQAFLLIWKNLPIAYRQAKEGEPEIEVLEKLHNASTMAGWGFSNSQIILSHALAHSIGAIFSLPHSLVIGTSCWYSLMYNKNIESKRISELGQLVGIEGSSDEEIAENLINSFKNLLIELQMPLSLIEMKITKVDFEERLEQLVYFSENDTGVLSNPRLVDHKDLVLIYQYFFEGKELDR